MTTVDKGSAEASAAPAAVYLLQRHDGQRFKIGWAMEPVSRVQRLPEFQADELDLVGSHVAWLPDAGRAKQIERVWAPVRTCCVLAGLKLLTGSPWHCRDAGADEADAGRLQTSA